MQHLKDGTMLQGGKYRIERMLGQGGFGITYLATHELLGRHVAIKEFFFKEYCERDGSTSTVTLGTQSKRDIVERFKKKFVKEAQTLSKLKHPNIIQIHDIFLENNTAYYVMEYIEGQSLGDLVKARGALPEQQAIGYVRKVASALGYIHKRSINHLDIKPNNIMLRRNGDIIVIDFGVAKQYDVNTKEGTTTTPVGISHGYSPSEQYKRNGVQSFSPESDIYALGATLYKLVTGKTPPEAIDVAQDGLPPLPSHLSASCRQAITHAMQPRKDDRPHAVGEFLSLLGDKEVGDKEVEATVVVDSQLDEKKEEFSKKDEYGKENESGNETKKSRKGLAKKILVAAVIAISGIVAIIKMYHSSSDTISVNPVPAVSEREMSYDASKGILTVDSVNYKMVYVAGGTFTMGATSEQGSDAYDWEKPAHSVTLSSYYIGQTEVTQALWKAVMGSNPSYFKGDNLPVEMVSWDDCQTFISELNAATGKKFRLPTEAEWEYAARGGSQSQGYKYSGGNSIDDVAWYEDNSSSKTHAVATHAVATKQANELGIYDMTGNVDEWCSDWYGDYSSESQTNPVGPTSGQYRVYRGGSWIGAAVLCRVSHRFYDGPGFRFDGRGLRLALSE